MNLRLLCFSVLLCAVPGSTVMAADLKVGMIGLDTSHAVEFTRRLNDAGDKDYIPGARVVVAIKGGSADIPQSANRVEEYTKTMQEKFGVKIVDSIDELIRESDVVMIESVDGRPHLEQAMPVIKAHKPLFVDKPVAGSLRDVLTLYRAARESGTPFYSGSSLRYFPKLQAMKAADIGQLKGAISCGPCELEPHHPDLFWYGIHATEVLYTVMGQGCQTVTCAVTTNSHSITGVWNDGKVGMLYGQHTGPTPYRLSMFGSKKSIDEELGVNYTPFLRQVVKFFQTGVAPVPPEETLEIYAFMEAADESKRQGGCPVKIADVIEKNGGAVK